MLLVVSPRRKNPRLREVASRAGVYVPFQRSHQQLREEPRGRHRVVSVVGRRGKYCQETPTGPV